MDQPAGRILGIDYGSKRVGVAMSDPLRILASGVGTWENDGSLLQRLADLVAREGIALVVVGMPYAPDGGKGTKAREVEEFIAALQSAVAPPVTTWDESYTSVRAHRAFIDAGMKRKQRGEKRRVDEMAARLLLQEFLENQRH